MTGTGKDQKTVEKKSADPPLPTQSTTPLSDAVIGSGKAITGAGKGQKTA